MKKVALLTAIIVLCIANVSCSRKEDASAIINRSIEASGMNKLDNKKISFVFRGKTYKSFRSNGRFELERITKDSLTITDILTNNGFTRLVNGDKIQLADTTASKYENSVNSVHYFAYLPYGLNGKAVNKELLPSVEIKGVAYYKIKVWFDQEGGGKDYEDKFVYWINKENFKVDYLAYSYHVNEGGMRFREAYNRRNVNGIDFVDYNNFKPKSAKASLFQLDSLFQAGGLELLSKIALKDVKVENAPNVN
ncbi:MULTISPECIES: DUF6503 family protein [Galbibacter]|uniref:Deoxyribose-phosphate aldolase n=1 Tax=Galbibacter pacificus TaxID=2996052 RepID=A0ABT6FQK5_9FLAO|nr:DUF6503 family protein [Galbibacter pacificus]MDG3581971.1 deoxyribose-phosphate aldolase [Galbibacter pacificus]MDG3585555.1 deoxyribose-phosphate aldolase [Galbibacter pacificus]